MFTRFPKIADGKTSVEDAWALCLKYPVIGRDFKEQAVSFKWPAEHSRFEVSAFWAYWFSRNVITDEWLPGEDLIMPDKQVWSWYVCYTEGLRAFDMLGWTLKDNEDFEVDDFGMIKNWKQGRGPRGRDRQARRERFDNGEDGPAATADRIAKLMEDFKKKKRLAEVSGDDDAEA